MTCSTFPCVLWGGRGEAVGVLCAAPHDQISMALGHLVSMVPSGGLQLFTLLPVFLGGALGPGHMTGAHHSRFSVVSSIDSALI